jgi:hypothetical protein
MPDRLTSAFDVMVRDDAMKERRPRSFIASGVKAAGLVGLGNAAYADDVRGGA